MNLFRSEEHRDRWLAGREAGATMSVGVLSKLAHAWYGDRLDPDWRPHSVEQNQRILESFGLTGDFWRLA
jgi:hypothetical protein